MGSGSFLLIRKYTVQNESEKKSCYFPELHDVDEIAKKEKKISGKNGPVGNTQWKNR